MLGFVRSTVRDQIAAQTLQSSTGRDDAQWWEENAREFAAIAPLERYPLATRIGAAAGAELGSAYDSDHAYRFGMDRIVDALAVLER